MKRAILIVLACAVLPSCVSPQKTYKPPSDAKVRAATKDLTVKVTKARETAAGAKKATEDAKVLLDQSDCANDAPLQSKVTEAIGFNNQLQVQLNEAERSRAALQAEVDHYAIGSAELAIDATNERNEKIVVQKKLLWYRLRWWGAWVVLGAAIVGWVLFGLLKVGVRWGTK